MPSSTNTHNEEQTAAAGDRSGSGSASTARQGRAQRGSESGGCRRTQDPTGAGGLPADGLVICAKSVRDGIEAEADAELSAASAVGPRFPRPDLVTASASLFVQAQPWAQERGQLGVEPESGRFRITIGPGVVRLGWIEPVRAEKASERATDRRRFDVATEADRIKCGRDKCSPPAREVTEWSRRSRAAMCRTFAELDYGPLVESGRVPAMITLTYPGLWEAVAPDGASVKRHMVLWRKRFQREWGEPARYIWKLEFQRRGAPHIHLWMAPPQHRGRTARPFAAWLSDTWAEVVGHPDANEKRLHRLAGTAIDTLSGLRACDPKRLAIYFTKHSSPNTLGDKEYQHVVPEPWRKPGKGPGRFWGVFGLKRATATVEIDQDTYLTARRVIRRWSRSQAAYGDPGSNYPTTVAPRTAYRRVPRVDQATGRVQYRRVRRRRGLCDQGGLAGGFALVNSGPGFAADLARAVALPSGYDEP